MGIQDAVPQDGLDVQGGLTEQILGEGGEGGVAVRGQDGLGEGSLGHGSRSTLSKPRGGHGTDTHQREGTHEVTQDGGAELGDSQTVLEAIEVAGIHGHLGVAAVGVGGVVLAGRGTDGDGREDEALLGQAKTLVLLGAHLGDLSLETG